MAAQDGASFTIQGVRREAIACLDADIAGTEHGSNALFDLRAVGPTLMAWATGT